MLYFNNEAQVQNDKKYNEDVTRIFTDIFFISAVRECHKIKVILVGKKHLFDNEAFIWQWKCMPGFWKFPHKDSRSQKYEDGKSIAYWLHKLHI